MKTLRTLTFLCVFFLPALMATANYVRPLPSATTSFRTTYYLYTDYKGPYYLLATFDASRTVLLEFDIFLVVNGNFQKRTVAYNYTYTRETSYKLQAIKYSYTYLDANNQLVTENFEGNVPVGECEI